MKDDFIQWAEAKGKRTLDDDRRKLALFEREFGSKPVSTLAPQDIESLLVRLQNGQEKGRKPGQTIHGKIQRSDGTINRYRTLLMTVCNVAVRNGKLPSNPVRLVPKRKERNTRIRVLTPEEERKLLEKAPAWLRDVIVVLLHTGLRRGELMSLVWNDVVFDGGQGQLVVRPSKSGKGRTVRLNSKARAVFERLRLEAKARKIVPIGAAGTTSGQASAVGRVFQHSKLTVTWAFHEVAVKAGLEDVHVHDLRHTWASELATAGCPLTVLRDLGGWTNLAMVSRYAHMIPGFAENALEALVGRREGAEIPTAAASPKTAAETVS